MKQWFVALILGATCANADVLELRDVALQYKHFVDAGRDPMLDAPQKDEYNLALNMDLLGAGYWNNRVHTKTDPAQFRVVGWELQIGAHLSNSFDVFYNHHSQHLLDKVGPNGFPVEDSIGVNIYLYHSRSPKGAVFE